ncbi:MAG TPA: hypothetical protein VH222_05090 [Phenylobacterium sp.]|nr:hypothetical protein [Phenylobacterium sp.]HEX4709809.1 hypothetical protein [Phenylobacterium sp.]
MSVEKFEDLDRDLATVGDAVAKLRRGEGAALRPAGLFHTDSDHLPDRRPQEEVVLRDLVGPAHPPGELQQPPDIAFRAPRRFSQITHPRRPETLRPAQARRDQGPGGLVRRS